MLKTMLANSKRYDIFHLLESLAKALPNFNVVMTANPSLQFPETSLHTITLNEEENTIHLQCNFYGLLGVDSSLSPGVQTQVLASEALLQYTCWIENQLYRLLHAAYKRFHPMLALHRYQEILRNLTSLSSRVDEIIRLQYPGFFMTKYPSVMSLQHLLTHLFSLPIKINSDELYWITDHARAILGRKKLILGDNARLGDRILTRKRLSITVGPILLQVISNLKELKDTLRKIKTFIDQYLPLHCYYHLWVQIYYQKADTTLTPHALPVLGFTSVLGAIKGIVTIPS